MRVARICVLSPSKAILLILLALLPISCSSRVATLKNADDAKSKAEELRAGGKDAVVVVVFPDGKVYPKRILVSRGVHGIVWYTSDGRALTLKSDTYPAAISCPNSGNNGYCFAPQVAPNTEYGKHDYYGMIGGTTNVDPQIEIVN